MAKCTAEQFFSIEPTVIVEDRPPTFDVYVYLQLNEHIILFRRKGESLEKTTIERMMKKGLKHYHVRIEDREAYQAYVSANSSEAAAEAASTAKEEQATQANSDATVEGESAAAATSTEEQAAELSATPPEAKTKEKKKKEKAVRPELDPEPPELDEEEEITPEDEQREVEPEIPPEQVMAGLLKGGEEGEKALQDGKKLVDKILKGPPKTDATMQKLLENPMAQHATTVAVYTVLFAMGLGHKNQMLLQDLIVASLMHDIGLTQLPPDLIPIPTLKRTPQQNALFEPHIALGVEFMKELEYTPNPRVMAIVTQHHEKFNGTGYPNHIESFRIDEFGQVVGFADLLDSICRGRHDGVPRSLPDALTAVSQIEKQTTFPEYFNPDIFKKIMRWLKNASGMDYMNVAMSTVEEAKEKLLKTG